MKSALLHLIPLLSTGSVNHKLLKLRYNWLCLSQSNGLTKAQPRYPNNVKSIIFVLDSTKVTFGVEYYHAYTTLVMKVNGNGQAKILTSDKLRRLFSDGFTKSRDRKKAGGYAIAIRRAVTPSRFVWHLLVHGLPRLGSPRLQNCGPPQTHCCKSQQFTSKILNA